MLTSQPIGTIFKWSQFPYQNDGEVKDRYFIYFGKTSYGVNPVMFHIFTTTTQLHYYHHEGGVRRNNKIFRIASGQYGFPYNCVLDIDMGVYSYASVNLPQSDIEYIDRLGEVDLRNIFNTLIHETNRISKYIKSDILSSLRRQDITGLKSI